MKLVLVTRLSLHAGDSKGIRISRNFCLWEIPEYQMESVMWNSTNVLSSTDKESGDPVHEIRNPRCGIQSKTDLDSPGPKAFPSRHKGSLQQGKIHLKKFTWRGASVVQCLALFGQNASINVTRIQDQKICENQEQRPYPSLLRKYVHDKGERSFVLTRLQQCPCFSTFQSTLS